MCDIDSFIRETRHIHMWDVTSSYVQRDPFGIFSSVSFQSSIPMISCVTWLLHMCDMTLCDMTNSHVYNDPFTCVTLLIYMWDKTHLHVRRDSFSVLFCVPLVPLVWMLWCVHWLLAWVTWCIHVWENKYCSPQWCDTRIHMWNATLKRDSMRDMTHSHVWHKSFIIHHNTLQHTWRQTRTSNCATYCSTLQRCNTQQHIATHLKADSDW